MLITPVVYSTGRKLKLEELEQVKTKYYEMLPIFKQMQTENQQMKMELKQNESIIQYMQNCIQIVFNSLRLHLRHRGKAILLLMRMVSVSNQCATWSSFINFWNCCTRCY
ncbi:hypothetical protein J1N35_008046 [Gossypium stocksii]|uniref:Uncharacterized protein n=1 Tax=Gossypium stocksii TaxID=47602 RepID=A0A9D3W8J4_9ROSI|nr:hypothetical protein J1N35_008046 [Gossypium stocksii]